ncbi:hypothetical protein D3C73_1530460 [compost metagenome]
MEIDKLNQRRRKDQQNINDNSLENSLSSADADKNAEHKEKQRKNADRQAPVPDIRSLINVHISVHRGNNCRDRSG